MTGASGVPHMILAALFFSLMTLFVKVAGQHVHSLQIVLTRGVVTLVFSYLGVRFYGLSPWGTKRFALFLRGFFGFSALCCLYYAVTKLPLADATVIQYSNPVFTALLAAWLLGERFTLTDLFGTLLSVAGVLLVARPGILFGTTGASGDFWAASIGLLGALFSAAAYVTVRQISQTEAAPVIVFYFPLVTTLGALPLALPVLVWPTPVEWLALVMGVGITAQLGQVFLTLGLKREPAGRAMAISYLQIVFAAVWGALFLAERPTPLTFAGAALVGIGTWISTRRRAASAEISDV